MEGLTRKSFLKSLVGTAVLIPAANGLSVPENSICNSVYKIKPIDAAYLKEKYGLTPIEGEPDTYDFFIGGKRYRYGFMSHISVFGLKIDTKERHRIITSHSNSATTLQAVRIEGKWQFPMGSLFPRDFPIHEIEWKVDGKGDVKGY